MAHVIVIGALPALPAGATSEVRDDGAVVVIGSDYGALCAWQDSHRQALERVGGGEGPYEPEAVTVSAGEARALRDLQASGAAASLASLRAIRAAAIAAKGG